MRNIQKAAVVAAMLGSVSLVGAGAAVAHNGGDGAHVGVTQMSSCKSHDLNLDILGNVGIANGLLGNLAGGEGNPGAQVTSLGSEQDCSNDAF